MIVLNLPRDLRNKPENVLLVGIMPGPSEPTNLNGFLKPLVDKLLDWKRANGLWVWLVRCALLCATCNLPAARKLCGFLFYNAHQCCSCCTKSFIHGFSRFDRENWLKRSRSIHLEVVSKIRKCSTKKDVYEIESKEGYRYTELLRLPYFIVGC